MGRTIRAVGNAVHNVLDQTVGKIPDLVQDPKGTIGDLGKIQPLKSLGKFGEDVVQTVLVDVGMGGIANDFGAGFRDEDLDKIKKIKLHEVMNPNNWGEGISNMLGMRKFLGLHKGDVNLFRKLGTVLSQEEKTQADIGELMPQSRAVDESTVMKKLFSPNTTRQYEGPERSQVERELMGLARMYAGRQQAIKGTRRRPGQRDSLLTKRR